MTPTDPAGQRTGGRRDRLASVSAPALRMVARSPRYLLTGVFTALVLVGLFGPRWVAAGSLSVLVIVLGWLLVLMGTTGGTGRTALRIGSLVLIAVVLAVRAAGVGLPH